MTSNLSMVDTDTSLSTSELLSAIARLDICQPIAEAGHRAALQYFRDWALDDTEQYTTVIQDPGKHGDASKIVDAVADQACQQAWRESVALTKPLLGHRIREHYYVSEEAGTPTRLVGPDTLVTRVDPFDGTTRALDTLLGFGVQVTCDLIRDPSLPAAHLAGAFVGGEVHVYWSNTTPRKRVPGPRRRRLDGTVYFWMPALGGKPCRLPALREDRSLGTIAAIATKRDRVDRIRQPMEAALDQARFYGEAGNPLLPALLLGKLDSIVEPVETTLHDSSFLIPFSLLGGNISTFEGEQLDYLSLYEANASNLDPNATPVPPYVAWVSTNPLAS